MSFDAVNVADRPNIHLSCFSVNINEASANGPICLSSNWFNYCCINCNIATCNNLLKTNPYVSLTSLDFTKAFDSVRHSSLAEKLATFDLPDEVYNWLIDYLQDRKHATIDTEVWSQLKPQSPQALSRALVWVRRNMTSLRRICTH